MFCMLQASSRNKTVKHEALIKEEEKVKTKVKQITAESDLTNQCKGKIPN